MTHCGEQSPSSVLYAMPVFLFLLFFRGRSIPCSRTYHCSFFLREHSRRTEDIIFTPSKCCLGICLTKITYLKANIILFQECTYFESPKPSCILFYSVSMPFLIFFSFARQVLFGWGKSNTWTEESDLILQRGKTDGKTIKERTELCPLEYYEFNKIALVLLVLTTRI